MWREAALRRDSAQEPHRPAYPRPRGGPLRRSRGRAGPGAGPARGHRLRRSGLANAVLVPNTYERPERAVGHIEAGDPAVVLFQATFDYAPHMDAVDWSVAEVAPRLRARVPDLGIRLVGKPVPGWSTSTGHQL